MLLLFIFLCISIYVSQRIFSFLPKAESPILKQQSPRTNDTAKIIIYENQPMPQDKGTDVHDHQIQESLKNSFYRLQQWYQKNQTDNKDTFNEIKDTIFNTPVKLSWEIKEKAYSTLRHIEKHGSFITSLNLQEKDILQIVWTRICHPINKNNKDELIKSLIEQLSCASINIEQTYCPTGRISRIIQSLESLDQEDIVKIYSLESLNKELSDKVVALLKNVPENTDPSQYIDIELKKDYLDSGIVNKEDYYKYTKDYITAVKELYTL